MIVTPNEVCSTTLDVLRLQYRDLTGFTAPRNLRAPLLKRLIDWHVRCIEKGVPRREAFFYRTEVINRIEFANPKQNKTTQVGTVLIREHNGRVHAVRKAANGSFIYSGRSYGSLTAVAVAITGVHRSGPRFFGIASKKSSS